MQYLPMVLAILLGLLGAANMIIGRKPEAKAIIDKLAPFQGFIGIAGLVLGTFWTLDAISVGWIVMIVMTVSTAVLGLIFGLDLIKSLTGSDALDALAEKVLPFKGILGMCALATGIWTLLKIIMPATIPMF